MSGTGGGGGIGASKVRKAEKRRRRTWSGCSARLSELFQSGHGSFGESAGWGGLERSELVIHALGISMGFFANFVVSEMRFLACEEEYKGREEEK